MKVVLSAKLSNQKKMVNFFRPKLFHRVSLLRYCKKERRKINYYIYIYIAYILYVYVYIYIFIYTYIYLYIYMYLFMVFSFLGLIFQLHEKMSCWYIYITALSEHTSFLIRNCTVFGCVFIDIEHQITYFTYYFFTFYGQRITHFWFAYVWYISIFKMSFS